MATTDDIPHSIIALARMFGWAVPGDRPSIAIAQWIEETGWGQSEIWRLGLNPFGVQDAKDAQYQIPGNGPYAAYADVGDAFRDRNRIIEMYRKKPGREMSSIYALLDERWCPGTKGGTTYSQRLEAIRVQHGLAQYDDRAPANLLLERPEHSEDQEATHWSSPGSPGRWWSTPPVPDPRDAIPPGHGSGTRRTMRTGTSGLGRLIGLIAIPAAGVLLSGGGGALLARLRGLAGTILPLIRGEGAGSVLSTVAGLLLGSGVPPAEAPAPSPLDSLEALVRRIIEQVIGVVGHAEVEAPGPGLGDQRHGIAARILSQLGVRRDVADLLIPIGVGTLNSIIGHQWGEALEASAPAAPGDPPLGRRLLDLVLGRWLA